MDLGVLCLSVGLYGATYFNLSISFIGFGLVTFFFCNRKKIPLLREVILSSLFMYLFFALSVVASAIAVGIDIGKINVIRVSAVGVLSQILPLTPLGLGTRDLSLIALFSSFGISREKTLVFSWVEFIVASIVSLSLVYAMSWVLEKTRDKGHELNEEGKKSGNY